MEENNRKKFPISSKMYLLEVFSILLAAGVTIMIGYAFHAKQVNDHYKRLSTEVAATVAGFLDGDYYEELVAALETDEYQAIREKAEETGDDSLIEDYLEEKGLAEGFYSSREYMLKFRQDFQDITYLYVMDVGDGITKMDYYINDPDEVLSSTGIPSEREPEFVGVQFGNESTEPTITNGEWGWLCSAYEPIYNSKGEPVASVGADFSMDDVMRERNNFLMSMAIGGAVVMALMIVIVLYFIGRVVVNPLDQLIAKMKEFTPAEGLSYQEAGVVDMELRSRDEIEELVEGVRLMQIRIMDYLNNLALMQKDKARRDSELQAAARIQLDMLPTTFPAFPNRKDFDIYAAMNPAKEVGGDYYDFFMIDDDHLGIAIGDVSGKGIPAALFMALTKSMGQARAMKGGKPSQIMHDVNVHLCRGNNEELFVTVWFGILTLSTGHLEYGNAGHEYPAVAHAHAPYSLIKTDNCPPMGMFEDLVYYDYEVDLQPGDTLVLYTDGVPDAKSSEGRRYGIEQMISVLNMQSGKSAKAVVEGVGHDLENFTGKAEPFDDITILCLTYFGPEGQKE